MIEVHYAAGQNDQAFDLLQLMRRRLPNANISFFLDPKLLQTIDKSLAFSEGSLKAEKRGGRESLSPSGPGGVEEDIAEVN